MTAQNPAAGRLNFSNLLWTIARFREAGISLFIIILVAAVTIRNPSFLTLDNGTDILLNISILAIVALGQTMVIITHGIDLSVIPEKHFPTYTAHIKIIAIVDG